MCTLARRKRSRVHSTRVSSINPAHVMPAHAHNIRHFVAQEWSQKQAQRAVVRARAKAGGRGAGDRRLMDPEVPSFHIHGTPDLLRSIGRTVHRHPHHPAANRCQPESVIPASNVGVPILRWRSSWVRHWKTRTRQSPSGGLRCRGSSPTALATTLTVCLHIIFRTGCTSKAGARVTCPEFNAGYIRTCILNTLQPEPARSGLPSCL